ncbi:hypothetical protein MKX01_010048 [Papaver californicum]|nr:hypothetical protein MKX01_010048 [Papaver californicum]
MHFMFLFLNCVLGILGQDSVYCGNDLLSVRCTSVAGIEMFMSFFGYECLVKRISFMEYLIQVLIICESNYRRNIFASVITYYFPSTPFLSPHISTYSYATINHFQQIYSISWTSLFSHAEGDAVTFHVRNKCTFPLWPATTSDVGHPTKRLQAPPTWNGRIWGRTGCDFTSTSNTKPCCQTGDCGGKIACNGNIGLPPATLVQVSLQPDDKPSFYDVSLVDGYNVPISVSAKSKASNCYIGGCLKDLNKIFPQKLQVACLAYNLDIFCCRNAYGNPNKCKPNIYSNMFKHACPSYYS